MNISANAQTNGYVKTSGIKAGIDIPVGTWSSDFGVGFNVADLTKWNITDNTRILGRMEITFFGGKETTIQVYPDYSYTYQTNPIGILTAGSGIEFGLVQNGSLYSIIDFPSMNIIIGTGTNIKVGFGIGLGYELSFGKALIDFEIRGNLYNAFLTQKAEKSIGGLQLSFEAAY